MAAVMKHSPRTVIVGLGKTGLSCARFLAARHIPVAVTDTRAAPPGLAQLQQELPDVAVFLNGFSAELLNHAEQVVVSPGVSVRDPVISAAAARGVPVIGDIELFAHEARAPVVAITGSNGKSTVTTLLGAMAQRAGRSTRVGGNLGTPALDLLHEQQPDLYVLELSSFQLETTHSLNAAAAVVLNVTPDHMDRYADVAEYTAAKQRAYRGDGVMVINADDALVRAMANPARTIVRFTLAEPQGGDFGVRMVQGEPWLAHGTQALLPARELHIKGSHNIANALAALALGQVMQLPMTDMLATLREFPGLPHRSQWVGEHGGVEWYNDSKGTNVGATLAALQGLAQTNPTGAIILIAGGDGKGADFSALRPAVAAHARAVVLLGRDAPIIEQALNKAVPIVRATDMHDAVHLAGRLARPGDKVLLSPACASFDMYSGYEERGQVFTAAVQQYIDSAQGQGT